MAKKKVSPTKRDIAANIKRYRKALKLSQEALARKARLSFKFFQRVEAVGQPDLPSFHTLEALSKVLGVPLSKLLERPRRK